MGLTEDLKSVTDELFSTEVVYNRVVSSSTRMMNKREISVEQKTITGLLVNNKGGNMEILGSGVADREEAYIIFHRQDLEAVDLAEVDGKLKTRPEVDFIIALNDEWRILSEDWLGGDFLATTPNQHVLVRFGLKRKDKQK